MKRVYLTLFSIMFALVLSGCNSSNEYLVDDEMPEQLEVELVVPESADVNETVVMKATVTYGDEKVVDADEVIFEVWEEGNKEESVMIDSTNNEDGTYEAETTFEKNGEYVIQVHVTAKRQHNMPTQHITVSEGE